MPRSLSSFDTHERWQPVTQSAWSWRSHGKIADCEQSTTRVTYACRNQLTNKRHKVAVHSDFGSGLELTPEMPDTPPPLPQQLNFASEWQEKS